ncbi:MAG TPA: ROK family protein [Firmicutes bacterium]|jgi:predicted NBD/HSP70 family sugar kinase|nr:ROK family protein [Bacillota bacterium]
MGKSFQNTAEIRNFNTKKIIEYLRFSEPTTRKDLAEKLGLSFATVSSICNQLIQEGFLQEMESETFNGGRIPKLVTIHPSSKYILCLQLIQKDLIKAVLVNLKNEVAWVQQASVPDGAGLSEVLTIINRLCKALFNSSGVNADAVLGIGVSAPGIFSTDTNQIVNSTNPLYENQPLKELLEQSFQLPVFVENESNLLVMATALMTGTENKNRNLIYLYFGEGLGTGIISDGKVVIGNKGLGGEISHIPIGNAGFQCYCGHQGCIETELTMTGFLRKYQQIVGGEKKITTETWEEFVQAVAAKQAPALSVIHENGVLIGKLLAILINIFDPEAIYIGGIIEKVFQDLYPYIIRETRERIIVNSLREVVIYCSPNYEQLIYRGCGEMVFSHWKPSINKLRVSTRIN